MNTPLLVAELGINHNGSFGRLCEMADTALDHAVYVKTQMRTPELCVPKSEWNKPKEWNGQMMTYLEYKKLMEFSADEYDEFNKEFDGGWFPSVWDLPSLELASRYDLPYIKIPSAMVTNLELIAEAAKRFPIVISTGMSNWYQVTMAYDTAVRYNKNITLLHCTSTYPTADEEVNLSAIKTLKDYFFTTVGFSSHSKSPYPAIYSMFYGAEFIEVHFTLDRTLPGTDQAASLELPGLELIARETRKIPTLVGDGAIRVYESELEPMKKLRGIQ